MPFQKERYPANWKQISLAIRERDGWACKWCQIPNGAIIRRLEDGSYTYYGQYTTKAEWDAKWSRLRPKVTRVVLTVAHIDHDSTNNEESNLAALCQLCHITHDKEQHAANAAAARLRRKQALHVPMFEDTNV